MDVKSRGLMGQGAMPDMDKRETALNPKRE